MIRLLWNAWARLHPYQTEWVEDLPSAPRQYTIYIIGGRRHPFYAAIVCSRRRCDQVIHLDLSPEAKRRWRVREHNSGRVSLTPSVHVTGLPCKCHYWLRRGCVVWSEAPPLRVPRENRCD